MRGKTCIVTGATAGIGFVTARDLARRGADVILVGRRRASCESAAARIRSEGGSGRVEVVLADLGSLASVRGAAEELRRRPRIDVLVNNAGAIFALRRESVDGFEMTLAVNHLGPFLLSNLLLPTLLASAPARIVNVSSNAHKDVKRFDFEDPHALRRVYPRSEGANLFYALAMPWAHPGFLQYAMSKLALILATNELARRLQGRGVTANSLHPGLVATSISGGNGSYGWFMRRYLGLRGISAEEGARTSIHLAASPEVEGVSGRYFIKSKEAPSAPAALDTAAAARLWRWSEELTGLAT